MKGYEEEMKCDLISKMKPGLLKGNECYLFLCFCQFSSFLKKWIHRPAPPRPQPKITTKKQNKQTNKTKQQQQQQKQQQQQPGYHYY